VLLPNWSDLDPGHNFLKSFSAVLLGEQCKHSESSNYGAAFETRSLLALWLQYVPGCELKKRVHERKLSDAL
jgi:hypothetical protein